MSSNRFRWVSVCGSPSTRGSRFCGASGQKRVPANSSLDRTGRCRYQHRRGIATFWLLLFVPVFLVLLGLVVNVANLWLARVELENALESAALAAVKEWKENPSSPPYHPTAGPRAVGVAYAAANTVRGQPVVISTNLDPSPGSGNPNANLACCVGKPDSGPPPVPPSGNLIFGAVYQHATDGLVFDASLEPDCSASPQQHHAVRAQAIVPVPSLWSTILGSSFPKGYVTVQVTAIYECGASQPRLVRVDKFECP